MDYILYFVFAGIILIALIIYWLIEYIIAKKIKLKAIEELDKKIMEEEQASNSEDKLVKDNKESATVSQQQPKPKKTSSKKK